jgi:molybdate transport system substrate-binding protein
MNRIARLLLVAGLPVLTPGALEAPSTLNVYAAASLTEAFQELGQLLERAHPGLTVRFNFAGSQQLALQIEQGAPADVFASADQRWMDYVVEKGQVVGEPPIFARNRLVVVVPRTNPARIGRLEDLTRRGTKIVLAAEAVPVGKYTRDALAKLAGAEGYPKDYDRRVLANVVSQEENVKSVVAKVQLGEADAGIVYQSDVTPSVSRYVRVFEIPDPYNPIAIYPIAVLKSAANAEAALQFVALVTSPQGQAVLQRYGLLAAAGAAEPVRATEGARP